MSARVFVLLSFAASAAQAAKVSGRVMYHSNICGGGARVTDEEMARLPPPAPIPKKEMLVVAGTQMSSGKPAARFVTQDDGSYRIELPPGTWCFFEASRQPVVRPANDDEAPGVSGAASGNFDGECLRHQRLRCDLVFEVKGDVSNLDIAFVEKCSQQYNQPCWSGPMPP